MQGKWNALLGLSNILLKLLFWCVLLFLSLFFIAILGWLIMLVWLPFSHLFPAHLRLVILGVTAAVPTMLAVTIIIGIIGGILIKGNRYSGFIAALTCCLIWQFLLAEIEMWHSVWYIPGLLLFLLTPFIGGIVYAAFNKKMLLKKPLHLHITQQEKQEKT